MAANNSTASQSGTRRKGHYFDPRVITDRDRQELTEQVGHIAHMLSEQGPMSITFVHNNTLLGLQDMHFEKAIAKANSFLGGRGFLENSAYREYYARGRINDADLVAALTTRTALKHKRVLAKTGLGSMRALDVYLRNMIHGFDALSAEELHDRLSSGALSRLDDGLSQEARAALLSSAEEDAASLRQVQGNADFVTWLETRLGVALAHPRPEESEAAASALLRELFDVAFSPQELGEYISREPEAWALRRMWNAVLGQLGIDALKELGARDDLDPLSQERQQMAQDGGAPIPIDDERRELITKIVDDEFQALKEESEECAEPADQARLLWDIRRGLTPNSLDRRGNSALMTLLARRQATKGPEAKLPEALRRLDPRGQMTRYAEDRLTADLAALEAGESHPDFLKRITGEDIVKPVNEYMIGLCSNFLDEGLAAWHMPSRATGFYDAWRNLARSDMSFDLDGAHDWRARLDELPQNAADAVISQLAKLGISQDGWGEYCGRGLAHLRGWAGMVFWRQENGDYSRQEAQPIDLMQYLAVRIFYQNLLVSRLCASTWNLQPGVENLSAHFGANLDEYFVRRELYCGRLSDGLAAEARALAAATGEGRVLTKSWQVLADLVWAEKTRNHDNELAARTGWPLFRLCQHLGMTPDQIADLTPKARDGLIGALDEFSGDDHGPVWLLAFEKHYRDEICNALALNRGRGRWLERKERPKSQVVFCIDEREESIHRHYEELDPGHETLGAAGFFGVAMDYQGLDDHSITPLCPAPVTPGHRILEIARPEEQGEPLAVHEERAKWAEIYHDSYWELKRNPIGSYFLIDVLGLGAALPLIGRVFFPLNYFNFMGILGRAFVPKVATKLAIGREDDVEPVGGVADGFTLAEQADRIETLLRNIGLLKEFAPIIVICAHGSHSENNPHENAHDCGACGGKNGTPNARAVAAMANNPKVRKLLAKRGIHIPDDSWFVGAIHNTATELVEMLDGVDIPPMLWPNYEAVRRDMDEAVRRAARERCRRFSSAPKDASLSDSLNHTKARALDFSQVRPEWGHATNACAIVGRRALTQGVFFDRRSFIISYDPGTDPKGEVLERILLAVGPVGAGINLEYYFSTVDPEVYGCDTKVPHNVTGLVGVMEGAHSDLRTGLPRQMTEVHEPMRLHLIVDAPPAIAGEIYGRQPAIQQLLDNEWVILIVHDPANGDLLRFVPGVGFEKWDDSALEEIPEVGESYDWYRGKYECFLPPARIVEPSGSWLGEG